MNSIHKNGKPVPTLFGGMAIIFHQTLSSYGINADIVFEQAGMRSSNLNTPEARISGKQYAELMRLSMEASGDPYFVLKTANFIQPSCFNALGFALFSSRTVRKFSERLVSYFSFLTTTETVTFVDDPEKPRLLFERQKNLKNNSINRLFLLGSLIWIERMLRLMHGPTYRQAEVCIAKEINDPAFRSEIETYFDCPVTYGGAEFALIFDPAVMDTPLPTANAGLAQQNDKVILDILARMAKADTPTRVRQKLLELLPMGEYSKATVSRELGYSVRALHNKLTEAGTSYQDLLDETRLGLASQYLRQERYSVGDVAFLLGFSDFSNFSRAFKKWTGQTPTEYREGLS